MLHLIWLLSICLLLVSSATPDHADAQTGSQANPKDIEQAEQLLSELLPACQTSSYSALPDGTVSVRVLCIGATPQKSMDGLIEIKDGIVRKGK
jgi:hypothetical protein